MELIQEHWEAVDMESRGHKFNLENAKNTIVNLIKNRDTAVTLVEKCDNDYIGVISFLVDYDIWDYEHVIANELLWYAKKPRSFIRLFEKMEEILLNVAGTINIGMPPTESLGRYLGKKGYGQSGAIYMKEVS